MEFKNETDRFDQHFLVDQSVIDKFISEAKLKNSDIVVEIGPGKGVITEKIAAKAKKLYVIEIDERLKPILLPLTNKYKNIEFIFNNVLDTFIPECDKIITSLPYSIVEPFINKIIKCQFNELLMITGATYADNVVNNKKNKLALLTNCYFKTTKIMDIIPEAFDPKPRVLSSMIKLVPVSEDELSDSLLICRYLFFFKGKKLKNALVESLIKKEKLREKILTQKEAKAIVEQLNFDSDLLNKEFMLFSNKELEHLFEKIELLK